MLSMCILPPDWPPSLRRALSVLGLSDAMLPAVCPRAQSHSSLMLRSEYGLCRASSGQAANDQDNGCTQCICIRMHPISCGIETIQCLSLIHPAWAICGLVPPRIRSTCVVFKVVVVPIYHDEAVSQCLDVCNHSAM